MTGHDWTSGYERGWSICRQCGETERTCATAHSRRVCSHPLTEGTPDPSGLLARREVSA